MKNCLKCGSEFDPYSKWGERKYCSKKCSNSRGPRTEEFKKIVSEKLKGRSRGRKIVKKICPISGAIIDSRKI